MRASTGVTLLFKEAFGSISAKNGTNVLATYFTSPF